MTASREFSRVLFGNADRLDVARFVAESDDGLVYATEVAMGLGIPQNRARAQLVTLVEAGLLETLPKGYDRRVFFQRRASAFWEMVMSLQAMAEDGERRDHTLLG